MPSSNGEFIWVNGSLVPWDEARVHVSVHALHYGSSVYEGIRAYNAGGKPAVFRLSSHVERLFDSTKIYRMEIPFSREAIAEAIVATVKANGHQSCYIRPLVFRGSGYLGLEPRKCPVEVIILTMEWGRYLGEDAIEQGVDVGVSSWRRMAPGTLPAAAKIGGQYINSQFMVMEAAEHGYSEAIALDVNGLVSEGSGANIFMARQGVLFTPPLASSILPGITRQCILTLAGDLDIEVREEPIAREFLYLADELFLTGTATEISPVRSVDHISIADGKRGPITKRLQKEFFGITDGRLVDRHGWLTPVV